MPRVSSLTSYGQCPGFAVLRANEPWGVSGQAAQNGSAVGRAVELWHRMGEDPNLTELLSQISHESSEDFPLYDEEQVLKWLAAYTLDPRNKGNRAHCFPGDMGSIPRQGVVADWQEREVTCTLEAAPDDPTGDPIVLVGHVDQVRRTPHGGLRVWDVKSSQAGGAQLVNEHAWQLAAYALGATQSWGEGDVLPGGIIRLRGYHTKVKHENGSQPVFWEAPWSLDQCREMMSTVSAHVSLIRQGVSLCNPGRYCGFCPGVSPSVCGDHLAQIPDSFFLNFGAPRKPAADQGAASRALPNAGGAE